MLVSRSWWWLPIDIYCFYRAELMICPTIILDSYRSHFLFYMHEGCLLGFYNREDSVGKTHPHKHTPISDSAGAQQDFSISAPFPLQHDIYIHRLIIYKDLLHAAMEARQLGHTACRVIGLRTTCSTSDMKY